MYILQIKRGNIWEKSDIRFELSIFENLILVEKMKKIEFFSLFLGTSKAEDYPTDTPEVKF